MDEIYEISQNDTFNRYLTAARFIKQGELILKEKPLLVDSYRGNRNFCLKCCTYIKSNHFEICDQCKVAILCRTDCDGEFHSEGECRELGGLNLKPSFLVKNHEVITVLRLLLKRKYSKQEWDEINQLESHLEDRRNTPIWQNCENLVEKVMKKADILSDDDEKNEIVQKLCGILDVNTFEIRPPRDKSEIVVHPSEMEALRGLYPRAALMAHDCLSNTHLAVDNDFVLYIHASVDIEISTPIFFNYANVLDGNVERNKCLTQGKYFECTCKRCMDPTELNTNISSLRCHSCRKGFIQPRKSDEKKVGWSCTFCKKNFHNSLVETTLNLAKDLIQCAGQSYVKDLEKVNMKLLQTLHPQHYLMLELQQILMGLYTQDVPSRKNLTRKIESCQNVIAVVRILEPGISRILGITLYELHAAKANLAYKDYSENEITSETLLDHLLSAEELLKSSLKHLLYEPRNSPEGFLAQNALGYLKKLRESISNIKQQVVMETNVQQSFRKKRNKN
ncbi:SET domain-containing protein SmydA-8-like isoform X2 [Coccinella septempunctata]|uniref:SET domain-containing protein SmydA-8-like isoform X2 n=1 Tax=Coccinella septempunctata TaxID=41139 RepID=UPI001D06D26B|nr:SET domain-containing protein SmydA-8-like isoform X2 [Coccinella septempunctata]